MFFYLDIGNEVDIFLKVVGIFLSIWTLRIAIRIFRNLDIKKEYTKKQFDTVLKLAEELESTVVWVVDETMDFRSVGIGLYSIDTWGNFVVKAMKEAKGKKHKKGEQQFGKLYLEYEENDVFSRYSKSIFVPPKIKDALLVITSARVYGKLGYKRDLPKDSAFLLFLKEHQEFDYNRPLYLESKYNKIEFWQVLLKQALHIKKEILSWLKEFGVNDLNVSNNDIKKLADLLKQIEALQKSIPAEE